MQMNTQTKTATYTYRFRDVALALSFRDRCLRLMRAVLGDDERVWVVTPAEAARLERQGYEVIA